MISIFLYIVGFIIFVVAIVAMAFSLGRNIKSNREDDYNPPFYTKDNWYHVLNPIADDTLIDSSEVDYQWYNEE